MQSGETMYIFMSSSAYMTDTHRHGFAVQCPIICSVGSDRDTFPDTQYSQIHKDSAFMSRENQNAGVGFYANIAEVETT